MPNPGTLDSPLSSAARTQRVSAGAGLAILDINLLISFILQVYRPELGLGVPQCYRVVNYVNKLQPSCKKLSQTVARAALIL
jgi:hypothetical protein